MKPVQSLRSFLYALLFYPATFGFVIAGLIASLFGNQATRALVKNWARFSYGLAKIVLGIRTEVTGSVPDGAMLIACKHQSMFETVEIVRIADTPTVVLKRELVRIPLFGWLTRRYGVIPVDRGAGPAALRSMMAAGRGAVAEQRPIVIYPEGTRVEVGETPPLQSGFAGLYRALGLPVVPVAVDSGRLWPKHRLLKMPGTVRFVIGETIPPGLKRAEIEARVHAAINVLETSPEA